MFPFGRLPVAAGKLSAGGSFEEEAEVEGRCSKGSSPRVQMSSAGGAAAPPSPSTTRSHCNVALQYLSPTICSLRIRVDRIRRGKFDMHHFHFQKSTFNLTFDLLRSTQELVTHLG